MVGWLVGWWEELVSSSHSSDSVRQSYARTLPEFNFAPPTSESLGPPRCGWAAIFGALLNNLDFPRCFPPLSSKSELPESEDDEETGENVSSNPVAEAGEAEEAEKAALVVEEE